MTTAPYDARSIFIFHYHKHVLLYCNTYIQPNLIMPAHASLIVIGDFQVFVVLMYLTWLIKQAIRMNLALTASST